MIQCKDCEHYHVGSNGQKMFSCDPYENIKEPECLTKWQLMKLDMIYSVQESQFRSNQKLAPLQDKIIKYVKREIEDIEDSEGWKFDNNSEDVDWLDQ